MTAAAASHVTVSLDCCVKAERFITGASYLINVTNTFVGLGNRTEQKNGRIKFCTCCHTCNGDGQCKAPRLRINCQFKDLLT